MLQPYRTSTLVVAEPKTIHEFGEVGSKYVTNSKQLEESEVVR